MSFRVKLSNGDPVVVLEPANIRKLKEGEPLRVNLSQLGIDKTVHIYFCPDQKRLEAEFRIQNDKKHVLTDEEIDGIIVGSKDWRELDRAAN